MSRPQNKKNCDRQDSNLRALALQPKCSSLTALCLGMTREWISYLCDVMEESHIPDTITDFGLDHPNEITQIYRLIIFGWKHQKYHARNGLSKYLFKLFFCYYYCTVKGVKTSIDFFSDRSLHTYCPWSSPNFPFLTQKTQRIQNESIHLSHDEDERSRLRRWNDIACEMLIGFSTMT